MNRFCKSKALIRCIVINGRDYRKSREIRKEKEEFVCLLQSSVVKVFNPTFHFFRSSGRTGTVRDGKDEDGIELSMGGGVVLRKCSAPVHEYVGYAGSFKGRAQRSHRGR